MKINNLLVFRISIFVGIVIVILIAVISKLNARPTVVIKTSERPYKIILNKKEYTINKDSKKFVLKDSVVKYRATNSAGNIITGTIGTDTSRHSQVYLDFKALSLDAIYNQVCNDNKSDAIFCKKQQSTLKMTLIDNNSWALITSEGDYAEAVRFIDGKWNLFELSRSAINSGQYPLGLEKAAREHE